MADDAYGGSPGVLADPDRLRSLRRACVDAAPDEAFDRFASLVKRLLDVPVALVSLVTDERQFFPGQVGLPEPWAAKRETPLSHSFCRHVIIEGQPKIYPDARIYAQVRDNLAIGELGVVAYAGYPLTDADGRTLGSLCAIDDKPRAWTKHEMSVLSDLAAACSSELRLRIARDVAEEARHNVEGAHEQLAMLAELTQTLAATLDIDEALRHLARAVTPRLADWCLISLVDPHGRVRQVAAAHHDERLAADVTRFAELMVTGLGAKSVVLAVQRTGQPIRRDAPAATRGEGLDRGRRNRMRLDVAHDACCRRVALYDLRMGRSPVGIERSVRKARRASDLHEHSDQATQLHQMRAATYVPLSWR